MAPWKSLEEKRAKAVACKERRKQRKFVEKVKRRAESGSWEEAKIAGERMKEEENRGVFIDRRKFDEIWAEVKSETKELAEEAQKISFGMEQISSKKVATVRYTNASARIVNSHSEAKNEEVNLGEITGNKKKWDRSLIRNAAAKLTDEHSDTLSFDTQAYVYENDCVDGMNKGVFSEMFDDANESIQIGSDSQFHFHVELIHVTSDTLEKDCQDIDMCAMYEDSNDYEHVVSESVLCVNISENVRMVSDDVSGDEIIQIQSRMNADEQAATIDKQVLVQSEVCKDECTPVINDAGSCVDLSERQFEEQVCVYDDKRTNAVNVGDMYRMDIIDLNDENELQEVVVVPNYVAVVSCANDLSEQLSVSDEVCIESPVEIDLNEECELQEVVVVPNYRDVVSFEKDVNVLLSVVDMSQTSHENDKAMLSLDSVMTTVVIATTSVLISGRCSSTVALMCMDVEFGERVVLVRNTVLLQGCGQMDFLSTDALVKEDVVIQVVTIMPCSQLCPFVPDDMFGWHVSVASELSTMVHECDVSPDLVEDFLNECSMKVGHENDNISIGLTELSSNNVNVCVESNVCQDLVTVIHDYDIEFLELNESLQDGRKEIVHYEDFHGCARVSFQELDALDVPVDDEQKPWTRLGSRRVNDFVVTWMTMTVLVLATQATSVKKDTAYVWPPSVDGDDALAIEYAFVMYWDMVHTVGGADRIQSSTVWSGFVKLFQNFVQNFVPELCAELYSRTLLQNFVPELWRSSLVFCWPVAMDG